MNGLVFVLMLSSILEKIEWNIAGFNVSLFMLIGLLFFLISIMMKVGKMRICKNEIQYLTLKIILIIFSFFQILFIHHGDDIFDQWAKGIFSLIIDFAILFSFSMGIVHKHKLSFTQMLRNMYILGLINLAYNIIQRLYTGVDEVLILFTHSTVSRFGIDPYGSLGRLTGLFTDSNNNGVFLVVSLIIFVYYREITEKNNNKVVNTIGIVLYVMVIVLTFSITAFVGLIMFVLLYFINNNMKKQLRLTVVVLSMLIVFGAIYSNNISIQQIISAKISNIVHIFDNQNDSTHVTSHFQLIIYSLKIWSYDIHTILIGTGNNCMNIYFDKLFNLPNYKAHNYYLQNLAEYGLIGFPIVCMILLKTYSFVKFRTTDEKKQNWYLPAAFFIILMANMTYDSMVQPFYTIFVFLCVSYNDLKIREKNNMLR